MSQSVSDECNPLALAQEVQLPPHEMRSAIERVLLPGAHSATDVPGKASPSIATRPKLLAHISGVMDVTFGHEDHSESRWCCIRNGALTVYTADTAQQVVCSFDLAACAVRVGDGPMTVITSDAVKQLAKDTQDLRVVDPTAASARVEVAEASAGAPAARESTSPRMNHKVHTADEDTELEAGSGGCLGILRRAPRLGWQIKRRSSSKASGATALDGTIGLSAPNKRGHEPHRGLTDSATSALNVSALGSMASTLNLGASVMVTLDAPASGAAHVQLREQWSSTLTAAVEEAKRAPSFHLSLHSDDIQSIGKPTDQGGVQSVMEGQMWVKELQLDGRVPPMAAGGPPNAALHLQHAQLDRRQWQRRHLVLHDDGMMHVYLDEECTTEVTSLNLAYHALDVLKAGAEMEEVLSVGGNGCASKVPKSKGAIASVAPASHRLHEGEEIIDEGHVYQLVEGRQLVLRSAGRVTVLTSPEPETLDDWLITLRIALGAMYQVKPLMPQSKLVVRLADGRLVHPPLTASTRASDVISAIGKEQCLTNLGEYALHEVVQPCATMQNGVRRRRLPPDELLLDVTLLAWEAELRRRYGLVAEPPPTLFVLELLKITSLQPFSPTKCEVLLDFHQALGHMRAGYLTNEADVFDLCALSLFALQGAADWVAEASVEGTLGDRTARERRLSITQELSEADNRYMVQAWSGGGSIARDQRAVHPPSGGAVPPPMSARGIGISAPPLMSARGTRSGIGAAVPPLLSARGTGSGTRKQSVLDAPFDPTELDMSVSMQLNKLLPAAWVATADQNQLDQWEERVVTAHHDIIRMDTLEYALLSGFRRKIYQHILEHNSGALSTLAAMRIVADYVRLVPRCFAAEFHVQLWTPSDQTFKLTMSVSGTQTQLLMSNEQLGNDEVVVGSFGVDDLISWATIKGMIVVSALLRNDDPSAASIPATTYKTAASPALCRCKLHLMTMEGV